MNKTLFPETPKKVRNESKKKKRTYNYKARSTLVLYFSNLSAYTKHFKTMMDSIIVKYQCQEATNIVIWIAKQNRYMLYKGFFTDYQLDIIEVLVENRYLTEKRNRWIAHLMPETVMDVSHIPPTANYLND